MYNKIKRGIDVLDRNSPKPLWEQLEEIIREKIGSNEWEPGEAIPSENVLSNMFGLSRMTARSTLTRLVQEGLIYRVPGKGTFVAEQKLSAAPLAFAGIREQLDKKGIQTTTEVIKNAKIIPPRHIANKLGLEKGEQVYVVERIRKLKAKFLSFHRSYLRIEVPNLISEERLKTEQLCRILEYDYNIVPDRIIETLEMVYATKKQAELFEINPQQPLLHLSDIIYMNNVLVEYTEVYFKGDQIKIHFDYDHLNATIKGDVYE